METAQYFGVDKSTIIRRLQDINLQQNKNKYRHAKRADYTKILTDKNLFIDYYASHTITDTVNYFNMSESNVEKYIKEYNISKKKNFNYKEIFIYYQQFGAKATIKNFGVSKSQLYRIINKEKM